MTAGRCLGASLYIPRYIPVVGDTIHSDKMSRGKNANAVPWELAVNDNKIRWLREVALDVPPVAGGIGHR